MSLSGFQGLRDALLRAIYERALTLRFHPVVSFGGGIRRVRAEIAWRHPEYGWLDRAGICAVARSGAAIAKVDARVLAQTANLLRAWQTEPPMDQVAVVIPLSHEEIQSPAHWERVLAIHAAAGWPSRSLPIEFEIGRCEVDTLPAVGSIAGARVSDLRSGFVLRYEPRTDKSVVAADNLPVRALQIAIPLHAGSEETQDLARRCRRTVEVARARYLDVIATGVETIDMLRIVADAGVDAVQGSITGGGLSSGELEDYLAVRGLNSVVDLQTSIASMPASGLR